MKYFLILFLSSCTISHALRPFVVTEKINGKTHLRDFGKRRSHYVMTESNTFRIGDTVWIEKHSYYQIKPMF